MTALWALSFLLKNSGMVDFGWPSGFTAMAVYYFITSCSPALSEIKLDIFKLTPCQVLAAMYIFCGLRFMFGWFHRNLHEGEDRRWGMWRERWRNGQGWLGIRSVAVNLFFFYHAQSLTNVFIFSAPLASACSCDSSSSAQAGALTQPIRVAAVLLWLLAFALENSADLTLAAFKKDPKNKGLVCQAGLWRYSRHPNYFAEWLIWLAYTLFTAPDVLARLQATLPAACSISFSSFSSSLVSCWVATDSMSKVNASLLLLPWLAVPAVAFSFLVHFTGVPMTEQASLKHRGEAYAKYQRTTNMFFPGWPKADDNKKEGKKQE